MLMDTTTSRAQQCEFMTLQLACGTEREGRDAGLQLCTLGRWPISTSMAGNNIDE